MTTMSVPAGSTVAADLGGGEEAGAVFGAVGVSSVSTFSVAALAKSRSREEVEVHGNGDADAEGAVEGRGAARREGTAGRTRRRAGTETEGDPEEVDSSTPGEPVGTEDDEEPAAALES